MKLNVDLTPNLRGKTPSLLAFMLRLHKGFRTTNLSTNSEADMNRVFMCT